MATLRTTLLAALTQLGLAAVRLGLTAAALALLLGGGLALSSSTASADVCEDAAIAFGSNDSEDDNCSSGEIFFNDANATNTSSPASFGFAWARTETDNASTARPTYAWSFNTNTLLGAALSANSVNASNLDTDAFGPSGSAYAISQNTDSLLVLAGAANRVEVSNTDLSQDAFLRNVHATSDNTRCLLCAAVSFNNVEATNINADGAVSLGSIYARTLNQDAIFSAAKAYNNVTIDGAGGAGPVLLGDDGGNGSYAVAENVGGIAVAPCVGCYAAAYNSIEIVDGAYGSYMMEAGRAAARNEYSSGSSAIGINNVQLINTYEFTSSSGLQQVYGYAFNSWSPDSTAVGVNLLHVQGFAQNSQDGIYIGSISQDADIWSLANNSYCYECTAKSLNDIDISGTVQASGSVFGNGAYAYANNEGPIVTGFADNIALAFNTVRITDTEVDNGDIVSGAVYATALNNVGGDSGSCYDCVAVAKNYLSIDDVESGQSAIDTSVYAYAENYNAEYAKALSNNKVKIEDSSAAFSIIDEDESGDPGSVFAHSFNGYCEYCLAAADNYVLIKDSHAPNGNVVTGDVYAWAENNLEDLVTMDSVSASEYGGYHNDATALAYNTLIVVDNGPPLGPNVLVDPDDIIFANVYSCASNNVGGAACGLVRIRDVVYDGSCNDCHAVADNFVKITGHSGIGDENFVLAEEPLLVFAHAENTAQGTGGIGACTNCTAIATNTVIATDGSQVTGNASSQSINEDAINGLASAENVLHLHDGASGSAQALAVNDDTEDTTAIAINHTTATDGASAESSVLAINDGSSDSTSLALGLTNATDGGEASNKVGAATGGPTSGVAVAVGLANADDNVAQSSSSADLANDGTANGVAVSVSYDANGNVALAAVVTQNGDGVAVAVTSAMDGSAEAASAAQGGSTSGDFTFDDGGDGSAETSTGAASP